MNTPEHQQLLDAIGAKTQQDAMAELGRLHGMDMAVKTAQVAIAAEADFEKNTLTFDISEWTTGIGPWAYAIVRLRPNAD